jgi:glycosyltransferase involved in cell wall biosynthesis
VAAAASFFLRMPVLVKITGRRQTTAGASLLQRLKLGIFKAADPYVVCPSPHTFEETRAFGIPPSKLTCIPNGVDIHYFQPAAVSQTSVCRPIALPEDAPVAIYVGRWAEGKGVDHLLDLWQEGMTSPDFPWHLLMVLSLAPSQELVSRIDSAKNRVHTVVGAADPRPYYQASDLAILLSEGEGLSNFLLESMACGLPTLATSSAALPDAQNEKTGTHTVPADSSLKNEALRFLRETGRNRDRLKAMGRSAREHIERHYSFDHIGPLYVALYRKMIDGQ